MERGEARGKGDEGGGSGCGIVRSPLARTEGLDAAPAPHTEAHDCLMAIRYASALILVSSYPTSLVPSPFLLLVSFPPQLPLRLRGERCGVHASCEAQCRSSGVSKLAAAMLGAPHKAAVPGALHEGRAAAALWRLCPLAGWRAQAQEVTTTRGNVMMAGLHCDPRCAQGILPTPGEGPNF